MMNTQVNSSTHLAEVRELARRFDTNAIEQCMQLALENMDNPCYSTGETEEIMSVLAKSNFVREQMEQGMSLVEAIRELGKRIRTLQNDIPSPLEGEG